MRLWLVEEIYFVVCTMYINNGLVHTRLHKLRLVFLNMKEEIDELYTYFNISVYTPGGGDLPAPPLPLKTCTC